MKNMAHIRHSAFISNTRPPSYMSDFTAAVSLSLTRLRGEHPSGGFRRYFQRLVLYYSSVLDSALHVHPSSSSDFRSVTWIKLRHNGNMWWFVPFTSPFVPEVTNRWAEVLFWTQILSIITYWPQNISIIILLHRCRAVPPPSSVTDILKKITCHIF